jgi:hypothetical protein
MLIFWNQQCNVVSVADDGLTDVLYVVMNPRGITKKRVSDSIVGGQYVIQKIFIPRYLWHRFVMSTIGDQMLPLLSENKIKWLDDVGTFEGGVYFNKITKKLEI